MKSKEKIIQSAIKLFKTNPNASLENIAKDCNVNRSTLHRQFKGRDELIESVFHKLSELYLNGLSQTILEHSDPKDRLYAVFNYDIKSYQNTSVLQGINPDKFQGSKTMEKINHAHQIVFEAIILSGICSSDIDINTFRLYYRSQLNFAFKLLLSNPEKENVADFVWRTFWFGISPSQEN